MKTKIRNIKYRLRALWRFLTKNRRTVKVKVKKLSENAVLPTKAHKTDAGFDLTATSREFDKDGNIVYGTELAFEIPEGYVGYIFPRSSVSKKDIVLTNCVGVIDAGYRGEVMAKFKPVSMAHETISRLPRDHLSYFRHFGEDYKVGERIGQLIIMPLPEIELEEATELSDTDRGEGGYGSTGK